MSGGGTTLVVEVLVSTGLLTAAAESVKWFLGGRGRAKVSEAQIVQGMTLDLLKPLHTEHDLANAQAAQLRTQLRTLEGEVDSVIGWALYAKHLLDSNAIPYRPVPDAVARREG